MTTIRASKFGRLSGGQAVEAFELSNNNGVTVRILAFGGIIQSFRAPDRRGEIGDIVLGYDTLDPYLSDPFHFGALIGRCAGRIARGELTIGDRTFALTRNEAQNTLHGGAAGFSKKLWRVAEYGPDARLVLTHLSPDGDQGFPGALQVRATYALGEDNALSLAFEAETSAPTIVNLTNHSYWRLSDETILDHELFVAADEVLALDAEFLATGETIPTGGTPFDFRTPSALRGAVLADHPQIAHAGGLDHCFVLRQSSGRVRRVATLRHARAGRSLSIETSAPGLQIYTCNRMNTMGKGREVYGRWAGIALEAQHLTHPRDLRECPATLLQPGDTFRARIRFRIAMD